MMRDILFRGKRVRNGAWIEGSLMQFHNRCAIVIPSDEGCDGLIPYEVITESVGQYTGLTDKNGNPIFEGDIVAGRFRFGLEINCACEYKDGAFGLCELCNNGSRFTAFTSMCNIVYEVIGNIFDNAELL